MSMSMEEPLAPILPLYSFYLLYRLRILNLILRFSESHVYFRVTADTFFFFHPLARTFIVLVHGISLSLNPMT